MRPNVVFLQKIKNPSTFNQFFLRNSGISHLCATLDLRKKILKSCTSENPYFPKKNQYFRTIGPSMAPLELSMPLQVLISKAPSAYIGFLAIYIGLEPILERKNNPCFFCWTVQQKKYGCFFLLELAPDLYRWPGNLYRHLEL